MWTQHRKGVAAKIEQHSNSNWITKNVVLDDFFSYPPLPVFLFADLILVDASKYLSTCRCDSFVERFFFFFSFWCTNANRRRHIALSSHLAYYTRKNENKCAFAKNWRKKTKHFFPILSHIYAHNIRWSVVPVHDSNSCRFYFDFGANCRVCCVCVRVSMNKCLSLYTFSCELNTQYGVFSSVLHK